MKLLVLGIDYAPEPVGIAPYTTDLTRWLVARGHAVAMVTAQPYYPAWRIMPGYSAHRWTHRLEDGVQVTRCPLYIPAHPSGARRIVHHASFAASALVPMLHRAREFKPDIVLAIAPSLVAAPVALAAARVARARSWLHIQDFEVDAATATGLLRSDSRVAHMATRFESSIFSRFGRVSSISPNMCALLADKGVSPERIVEFRNWSDTQAIRPLEHTSPFHTEWGISTPHVALYSGNLANKQGIEVIVEAARSLRHRSDLTFVICGDGPTRSRLVTEIAELNNVQLREIQPYDRLRDLLGLATVHLLPQVASAADLVLPSKLTNILASGRPVVATAIPGTGLANEAGGCGIVTAPGDNAAFANAITTLIDDPVRYATAAMAARARALERWSRESILQRIETALLAFAG